MRYEKKVSVCMMVKNEEKNLNRCLESLRPIIDTGIGELIIVDTGSEDNTIEIAKKYTDKVYEHQWNNNFSDMRNITISYAKGEWIWIMDADEEIENPEEMVNVFNSDLSNFNTIIIKMKNYTKNIIEGEESQYNISILNRGFRNVEDFCFQGNIHEQPNAKHPYFMSNIIIGHYGYIWEDPEFTKKKFERTVGLITKELEKDPKNIYFQFQLAVSWTTINLKEGLIQMRKAFELVRKLPFKERLKYIYVYGVYAKIAFASKKYSETMDVCREGLTISKDYIDLWYFLGTTYLSINNDEKALDTLKGYLKCWDRFEQSVLSKDPSLTFYCAEESSLQSVLYYIGLIYAEKKDYDMAIKYISKMRPSELKSKFIANIGFIEGMEHFIIDYLNEIDNNEGARSKFFDILEKKNTNSAAKLKLSKDIINYYHLKGKELDGYYLLNKVRVNLLENKEVDCNIVKKLNKLDFNKLPYYYGDIIVYIVKHKLEFNLLEEIDEIEHFNKLIGYVWNFYDNFHEYIFNYLYNNINVNALNQVRFWLALARNVLLTEKLETNKYMRLFNQYIEIGREYLYKIYNEKILENNNDYHITNNEHRFFFYLAKASEVKNVNKIEYIRNLRKALKYNPMKKGIEILLEDIKKESNNSLSEFEYYKKVVKNNINMLISENKIYEAKLLIDEYLKIVPDDLEMLVLKSELYIYQ